MYVIILNQPAVHGLHSVYDAVDDIKCHTSLQATQ